MQDEPQYTRTGDLTAAILLEEVKREITDQNYLTRTHGKPGTYIAGCRGHLCRYIERTRRRERRTQIIKDTLPAGVRPDTRPRAEQKWDKVLAALVELVIRDSVANQDLHTEAIEKIGRDEMTRYLAVIEVIANRKVFVPAQRLNEKITEAMDA